VDIGGVSVIAVDIADFNGDELPDIVAVGWTPLEAVPKLTQKVLAKRRELERRFARRR
jgi:hypothetical protein